MKGGEIFGRLFASALFAFFAFWAGVGTYGTLIAGAYMGVGIVPVLFLGAVTLGLAWGAVSQLSKISRRDRGKENG